MPKSAVKLSTRQAQRLLEQLPPVVKVHLVRRWEQQTWPVRLRQLLARIDRRLAASPGLARAARKSVGPARRAFHARRHRH